MGTFLSDFSPQASLPRKLKDCPASDGTGWGSVTERTCSVPASLKFWNKADGLPGRGVAW